jgi:hypothetical protein
MLRHRIRDLVAVFGLLALALFTLGASPAVLELRNRIAALEAESGAEFVVVDSSGLEIGLLVGGYSSLVVFKFDNLPVFGIPVRKAGFGPVSTWLWFTSNDCSGTPLLEPTPPSADALLSPLAHILATGKTYLPPETGTQVAAYSVLAGVGSCTSLTTPFVQVFGDAILVPQLEAFVPPFEVVTRAEFLAMQGGGN